MKKRRARTRAAAQTSIIQKSTQEFLDGSAEPGDIDLLLDICDKIEGNCLCPLGDACAMPVRAILKKFRHEFETCLELGGSPLAESSPLTSLYPTLKKLLPMVPA